VAFLQARPAAARACLLPHLPAAARRCQLCCTFIFCCYYGWLLLNTLSYAVTLPACVPACLPACLPAGAVRPDQAPADQPAERAADAPRALGAVPGGRWVGWPACWLDRLAGWVGEWWVNGWVGGCLRAGAGRVPAGGCQLAGTGRLPVGAVLGRCQLHARQVLLQALHPVSTALQYA
jgi:hypothetical protein